MKTKRKLVWLIVWGSAILAISGQAWSAQASEWTLKVSSAEARVRLKPDPASAVVSVLTKGTILKSFAREGEWFRVVTESGREGFSVIGYVASTDVEIVEKKAVEESEFWEEATAEFRGVGLSVRLGGGFLFFGSGDIEPGVSGMFDETEDLIRSLEAVVEESNKVPFKTGYDIWGDVIYHLNSRIGVGLRFDYFKASSKSTLRFTMEDPFEPYTIWSMPDFSAISISPSFYYSYPLNRLLTFVVNGGPTLYFVDYEYGKKFIIPLIEEDIYQKVKANRLGFQGGIGLEFRLNPRVVVFVETQGRYARISNLEGEETFFRSWFGQIWSLRKNGSLYYEEGDQYPGLVVLSDESAAGEDVRKAVLDFSGVSLALGLRIRF